ncbi:hypothetical protein WN943_013186 [Citrus x changshan-huyou]
MEEEEQQQFTQHPEFPCSDPDNAPQSTSAEPTRDPDRLESTEPKPSFNQNDIVKALEVVERDSVAIADSFSSLFASLRLALSEPDLIHHSDFNFRLNEEMKGIDNLAAQLYPFPVSYVICFTLLWLFFCFFELLRKDPLVYPALFLNGCGWMRRWLICCYFIKMAEKLIFRFVFLQILKMFIIAPCDTLIGLSLIIVVFWFLNSCEENS